MYHRRVWHYADHLWRDDDGPAHKARGPPPKNAIERLTVLEVDLRKATRTVALLRLRPIMMTALVAALGLLPAALSTVLYAMPSREGDHLEV